jgi:hypothetical protein
MGLEDAKAAWWQAGLHWGTGYDLSRAGSVDMLA